MKKTIVEKHFDKVAKDYDYYKEKNSFYYDHLKKLLKTLIPQHKNVFEFGCGTGDLIVSLNPASAVGYDPSYEMVKIAKKKHKGIIFTTQLPKGLFNYIFMSDVIEHLENPKGEFKKMVGLMTKKTVFICTMANPIWEPVLMVAEKLGLKMPEGPHTRIKNYELRMMMEKAGLKITKHDYKLLMPIYIPFITSFINNFLENYFKRLSFIEYFVAVKV